MTNEKEEKTNCKQKKFIIIEIKKENPAAWISLHLFQK